MTFLHTSDWHIGKNLKGRNRLEEQAEILLEITKMAVANHVDAMLIAGDIYENAAPTADAQALVIRTLNALARRGIWNVPGLMRAGRSPRLHETSTCTR